MLIKEYRIPLPLTVEEYRIAQLYMIAVRWYQMTKKSHLRWIFMFIIFIAIFFVFVLYLFRKRVVMRVKGLAVVLKFWSMNRMKMDPVVKDNIHAKSIMLAAIYPDGSKVTNFLNRIVLWPISKIEYIHNKYGFFLFIALGLLPKSALTVEVCIILFFFSYIFLILSLNINKFLIHQEEAYNAYPYTRTRYTCPFVEKFSLEIETYYFPDDGHQENVFNLDGSDLRNRVVGEYQKLFLKINQPNKILIESFSI